MEIHLGSCGDFAIPMPPFPLLSSGQIWFVRVDPRFALTFLLYLRLSALRCLDTHRRSPTPLPRAFAFAQERVRVSKWAPLRTASPTQYAKTRRHTIPFGNESNAKEMSSKNSCCCLLFSEFSKASVCRRSA